MLRCHWNRDSLPSRTSAPAASRRGRGHRAGRLVAAVLAVLTLAPLAAPEARATRIDSAADPALAGALVQTFDAVPVGYFASQSFLIGTDGFTISALSSNVHIDDVFCDDFGTSGRCFDTVNSGGTANDDVDIVFTGAGVLAFGFALNALDVAWTVTTYGAGDVLLGTYVVASQSPGLTGNARRGYFGATESAAIQSIRIRSTGSDRALIDDFAYVPVPEPGAAVLIGLGLAFLARGRRRLPASA
jgi:hypothetical protein